MASQSRKLIRDAFAALLTTALVPTNKAQAVYGYQVGDFAGQSPVVTVTSGPIERTIQTFGGCWRAQVQLLVHVFVLYSDKVTWGEDDAEDALDAIEVAIADVLLTNQSSGGVRWNKIAYAQPTQPDGVEIGGVEYRREIIQLQFDVIES
jgi:hypothetical protein